MKFGQIVCIILVMHFLYIYISKNRSSSIIFCHFPGAIHTSLCMLVDCRICTDFFLSSRALFAATFVIFFSIFVLTRSAVTSSIFWIALFEAVLRALVSDFFCGIKKLLSIHATHVFLKRVRINSL